MIHIALQDNVNNYTDSLAQLVAHMIPVHKVVSSSLAGVYYIFLQRASNFIFWTQDFQPNILPKYEGNWSIIAKVMKKQHYSNIDDNVHNFGAIDAEEP